MNDLGLCMKIKVDRTMEMRLNCTNLFFIKGRDDGNGQSKKNKRACI